MLVRRPRGLIPRFTPSLPATFAMDVLLALPPLPGWVQFGLVGLVLLFLFTKPKERSLDLYLADNLEAIAISIAMALVLKFFVVEAYQIPTGSMQPTILGYEDNEKSIKDRVLADKLVTMLRDPRRWEVMIFRFPLDERRLYVKRIVGLPGERLEVRGGDIWINGAIARKPDHVNASVLKPVLGDGTERVNLDTWFSASGATTLNGDGARFGADGGSLTLRAMVRDEYLHGYETDWGVRDSGRVVSGGVCVPDLQVSGRVRLPAGAEALRVVIGSDEGEAVFVLPRRGGSETARVEIVPLAAERAGRTPQLPARVHAIDGDRSLPADADVSFVARWIDRQLVLEVDGDEWLRVADDEAGPRSNRPTRALVAFHSDGDASLSQVDVRRDIFYKPSVRTYDSDTVGTWQIPEDSYFGMGDNTQASHDSRSWETRTVELRDGTVLSGFDFPPANTGYPSVPSDANPQRLPDGRLSFADVHGDSVAFDAANVVAERSEPAPFIHRRYLLGKAVTVFWPVFSPFRWKLIQ